MVKPAKKGFSLYIKTKCNYAFKDISYTKHNIDTVMDTFACHGHLCMS